MNKQFCVSIISLICAVLLLPAGLFAQTNIAVPLDDRVYYILDQAQMRGLCPPLPLAKPYSEKIVRDSVKAILDSGSLSAMEQKVLQDVYEGLQKPKEGFTWGKGLFFTESAANKFGIRFSGEVAFKTDTVVSGGVVDGEGVWAFEFWPFAALKGDMGERFSYNFTIEGGMIRSPRSVLGQYHTYYGADGDNSASANPEIKTPPNVDKVIDTYSQASAYLPYSYKKRWDGFVWNISKADNASQLGWPEGVSVGYRMLPELAGTLLGDHVFYRMGRLDREWAGQTSGSSLVFNQSAQPFLAIETTISPFSWLNFSSLTGVLEYYDALHAVGLTESAKTSQNAFSINQLELNYKSYVHFDIGSTAVWPKRFELGYLFPLASNFLYQDNIGDFDNVAVFFNLKGQYPKLGNIWFSFFLDEVNLTEVFPIEKLFTLDRAMFAYQVGASARLPFLPFGSVSLRYTKIEPYCYTHQKINVPWYGSNDMETAYTNNGVSLGYYLPPNSDEICLRFETMPAPRTSAHLQYQMIRHGADYGSGAVDGSSLLSELDPVGRSENPVLAKRFLRDGAYQWQHIIRVGGEYTLSKAPVRFFGEVGVVISYFTNIAGPANSGKSSSYSIIDTAEYPKTAGFIATLGVRIFP